MDSPKEPSPEATGTPQIMEQYTTAQHDTSLNLDAQTPASSPESTEPEPALPILRTGEGKKITKIEIPDSESVSGFSSPEKTIRVDVGTHDAETSSFVANSDTRGVDLDTADLNGAIPNPVALEEEVQDEASGQGASVKNVVGDEDEESGVEVTSGATGLGDVLTAPVEASEVEDAVDTTIGVVATSIPETEISSPEEDGQSGLEFLSEDEESKELPAASIGVKNAMDMVILIDTVSPPETDISKPEEVPIDQARVILQAEEVAAESLPVVDEKVKEGDPMNLHTSHETSVTDYSKFKVPELKRILQERGLAVSGNKLDLIARLAGDDKALEAVEVDDKNAESSPAYFDEVAQELMTPPSNKDAEMSEMPTAQADDEDVVMADEVTTQAEGCVDSGSSFSLENVSEKDEKSSIAPEKTSSAQRHSIPDSDDEELPDAPSPVEEEDDAILNTNAASTKQITSTESVSHDDVESNPSLTPATAATKALELLPNSSQVSEVAVENILKMRPSPSPSHSQNSVSSSPVKTRVSPNPSFKVPSPVHKTQSQSSSSMMPPSPSKPELLAPMTPAGVGDKSVHSTGAGLEESQKDGVMSELKALKMASIQARITSLQAEIAIKRAKRDELQQGLLQPAAETVKRHIKLLHDYNDIKDIGQGLVGMIADQRGLRVGELYEEFGVDLKD